MKQKTNQRRSKSFQEIQDNIFRAMSADKKVKVGSQLWRLAKELVGDKINFTYEGGRPSAFIGKNR